MEKNGLVQVGAVEDKYTSAGNWSGYMIKLYHEGLEETRHLSAREDSVLEGKVNNQINAWNKKWERQEAIQDKKNKDEQALEKTQKSKTDLEAVEGLLAHTLNIDDAIDWETMKNEEAYSVPKPNAPTPKALPDSPLRSAFFTEFHKPPFLKIVFGGKARYEKEKAKHEKEQEARFQRATEKARDKHSKVVEANQKAEKKHAEDVAEWQCDKDAFTKKQNQFNLKVDEMKHRYLEKDTESIIEYCEMVLNNSEYPDSFPKDFELQFNETNGMLLIDFQLPGFNDIPSRTMVKYVKSTDQFTEKFLSQAAQNKLFDSVIYQIALRTLHELFEADVVDAISSITFNGIITALNPASGHEETKCIMSIQAAKAEFMEINLASIDPKTCFKALKGVGSAKLSTITPVRPILELDKSDKRFKDHYDVADAMDESTNLAAMDWQDFEHLVRELFEKEFAQNGGEVKVTQASSDGGVDAIAFDPDPIRGGKIVIQAKRYTNVVGVAAVRDLYGTVMNEGATKGILVTTSDYGAESYAFAKDKPITLLNGSNLLHLLDQHGHKAKIDIKEAKILMKED
jgi:restriction system protein